jgi:hypothetical protein
MNMQTLRRGMTARPATHRKVGSNLVRRLVQAQDDPAKQRIRAWLREIDDEQLSSSLGLTPEDIAVLRGTQTLSSSRREPRPSKHLTAHAVGDRPFRAHPTSVSRTGRTGGSDIAASAKTKKGAVR